MYAIRQYLPFWGVSSASEEVIRKPINKKLATACASWIRVLESVESTVSVELEKGQIKKDHPGI
jgi:hypothetical protein